MESIIPLPEGEQDKATQKDPVMKYGSLSELQGLLAVGGYTQKELSQAHVECPTCGTLEEVPGALSAIEHFLWNVTQWPSIKNTLG